MSITLDGAAFYAKVENIRQELSASVSTISHLLYSMRYKLKD
jgi:hypothetical protein